MSLLRNLRRARDASSLDANLEYRRLLFLFTYIAGLVAIQIMHLALNDIKLNLALSGGLTAGFIYAFFLEPRWRALTTYAVSAMAVVIAIVYFLRIRNDLMHAGNYLGILAGVLVVLLAFKAFTINDHRFILMFLVVFLLYSSVASFDLRYMMLLPIFLIFSGLSLYLSNQIDVALWVADTAERIEGKKHEPRVLQLKFLLTWQFIWILGRAVFGILMLSVVAYLWTPHAGTGSNYPILNTAPEVADPGTKEPADRDNQPRESEEESELGVGSDFDLTSSSRLSDSSKPLIQLKTNVTGGEYLRAQVYDTYTGSGWVKSKRLRNSQPFLSEHPTAYQLANEENTSFSVPLIDFPSTVAAEQIKKEYNVEVYTDNIYSNDPDIPINFDYLRQEIKLLEDQPPFYFSYFQPVQLQNISLTLNKTRIDTPMLTRGSNLVGNNLNVIHPKGFTYTVFSLVPKVGAAQLDEVYQVPPQAIMDTYTQLPLDPEPTDLELEDLGVKREEYRPISNRLKNFAKGLVAPKADAEGNLETQSYWDKVMAIQDYLSNPDELTYAREFTSPEGDMEITEAFLFGTGQGFCRYFASSMVVLCRLNDIPARVVSGFAPGTYDWIEGSYTYAASNAHAWVEVYFDGYGWVRFDPTPTGSGPADKPAAGQWLAKLLDFLQDLFVIDPAGTREAVVGFLLTVWEFILDHKLISFSVAAGLALLIALIFLLRRKRSIKPVRRFVPENEVIAAYSNIVYNLRLAGVDQDPGSTARVIFDAAIEKHEPLREPLEELLPVFELAAYAPYNVEQGAVMIARGSRESVSMYVDELIKAQAKQKRNGKA